MSRLTLTVGRLRGSRDCLTLTARRFTAAVWELAAAAACLAVLLAGAGKLLRDWREQRSR